MQNIDWQQVATFLFVAAAGGYAIRRLYHFFTRKADCSSGGCGGCAEKNGAQPDGFVSLNVLTSNRKRADS